MLVLPLVFVDLSSDRVSVQENRMLAERPKLAYIKSHPGTFIKDFDAWFKDSTGFREKFLTLYNIINKNKFLNCVQYTEGAWTYLVGENGHHYFADIGGRLISVFQGKPVLSDEQLKSTAEKLEKVKEYLDKQGIPFIVMFCTMKESIYPEFYPKSIIRGHEPIQIDVITNFLRGNTSVDVFNIRQALLEEKKNYLLYHVNGDLEALTHYNQIGAFFVYRELMRHINKYFPELISFELNDIIISYDEKAIPHASFKTEKAYEELPKSFFDGVNFADIDFYGLSFNNAYENRDSNLPVILLLRTSFSGEAYSGKFIAQTFSKTIMTHFVNMEYIEEYVSRFKPDIVIFEAVERQLDMFADAVIRIPDLP
jgi:hypothetical protein